MSLYAMSAPLATAVGYFLAAKIGAWLAFPDAPVSALWAPNAIVLAALLLTRREHWWRHLAAILPLHLLAQLPHSPLAQVLIQYGVNGAEAVLGAYAIQEWSAWSRECKRLRTATALVLWGGLVAPLVTSIAMAAGFAVAGIAGDFWLTVLVRTITNTFAVVAIVPLIVHSAESLRAGRRAISPSHVGEASALALALGLVCMLVFVVPNNGALQSSAFLYTPLPILAWAAIRFGVTGACASTLLVGAISTWGVLHGHGPFSGRDPVANALSVVAFHVVTVITFVMVASLIEEWKLATRALTASEARFRTIFEHNIIPTVICENESLITDANDAFLQLTGFSRADIARAGVRVDHLVERRHEAAASGSPPDPLERFSVSEKELRLPNGRRVPVILGDLRFGAGAGGILYALDLSAFRSAEAGRQRMEGLHAAVLDSLEDQIAVLDSAGTVIEVNDSWRRVRAFGSHPLRQERVLAGQSYLDVCASAAARGEDGARDRLDALRAVLDGSEIRANFECTNASSDEPRWTEISIERLRRPEGGAVITCTDVTARKRAEIEARNQRQQLTHLGRAAVLGQLSGAFAHELNQPLTSILGNAEAAMRLIDGGSGSFTDLREIISDIIEDDVRAGQVIQRLRALLGKGDIVRRPVDLNATVRDVLELVRTELVTRNVRVATELDPKMPLVMADRVQMQQVILNLVMNACEAMGERPIGERTLVLGTHFVPRHAAVELTVRDRGNGIPGHDLERIFQPFVTTKMHGMGLGLAICRSVAESHRGRLWAENALDGGAVFHLRVPLEGGLYEHEQAGNATNGLPGRR
jgi:PAS domain S-box-containing protein